MAFLNNVLVQLFDNIETNSNIKFASFTTNEATKEDNIINKTQTYMEQYERTYDNTIYKYLYDPELAFDFRFHQRIANIAYADKKSPWVTILFNTQQVKPLTGVLSHKYSGIEQDSIHAYEYSAKRVLVPVNMVLVSNDLTYLYQTTERMAMYFDRIINFHYNEHVDYSSTFSQDYSLSGMAKNIQQVDLTKLDTQNRGSIVTTAFSFDLIYYVIEAPYSIGLLEKVILEVKVKGYNEILSISVTE